jgi:hypothetical protein
MKNRRHAARRSVLLATGILGLLALLAPSGSRQPALSRPARAAEQEEAAPARPAAARLRVRAAEHPGEPAQVRDPAAAAWDRAAPTRVLLNRTPRIYQTEKRPAGRPPLLEVRALRCSERLVLRLVWDDATKDAPQAPPRKRGEGGTPDHLYKRPTGQTTAFADAAAVMLPRRRPAGGFPSLVMGDGKEPVQLYYWNASRGAEQLTAAGRARVERTGKTFPCRADYRSGKWAVTLELPATPAGYPLAFALWDGHSGDRDGLKFFSVWYVLE